MKASKFNKAVRQSKREIEAVRGSMLRQAVYRGPGFPMIPVITWILRGEHFPRHLQIAYGRGVYRLLKDPAPGIKRGLTYLRDLPLGLRQLDRDGYPYALLAYAAECARMGQTMSL